ncbi:hypothetical protein D3C85_792220 [compost metagenome]
MLVSAETVIQDSPPCSRANVDAKSRTPRTGSTAISALNQVFGALRVSLPSVWFLTARTSGCNLIKPSSAAVDAPLFKALTLPIRSNSEVSL